MDHAAHTEKLFQQLTHSEDFWTAMAVREQKTRVEMVTEMMGVAAESFLMDARLSDKPPSLGQEAQTLTDWHQQVRGRCTEAYANLQEGIDLDGSECHADGLERDALNRIPGMVALNGIRMAVGQLARDAQRKAHGTSYRPKGPKTPVLV